MVEKNKNADENQRGGSDKPNLNAKKAKTPDPLLEQAPRPANSRLRDSDKTIPLVYPPFILEDEKSKKPDGNQEDKKDDEDHEPAKEEDDKGAQEKTGEAKNSFLSNLLVKLKMKKEE